MKNEEDETLSSNADVTPPSDDPDDMTKAKLKKKKKKKKKAKATEGEDSFDWWSVMSDDEQACVRAMEAALPELRANAVSDEPASWLATDALLRCARARELDVAKALTLLNSSLEWRRSTRPDLLTLDDELAPIDELGTLWIGEQLDLVSRPVVYIRPGAYNPATIDARVKYLVYQLETAVQRMAPGVSQMTWICDFSQYGSRARSPGGLSVARQSLNILQTNYCERLGRLFVLNAPFGFSLVFSLISPFMSSKTKAKIEWLSGTPDELQQKLASTIAPEALERQRLFERPLN